MPEYEKVTLAEIENLFLVILLSGSLNLDARKNVTVAYLPQSFKKRYESGICCVIKQMMPWRNDNVTMMNG